MKKKLRLCLAIGLLILTVVVNSAQTQDSLDSRTQQAITNNTEALKRVMPKSLTTQSNFKDAIRLRRG